jgi:predicted aldo/keto reductase-like oxidoreductase
MKRREFLRTAALSAAALGLGKTLPRGIAAETDETAAPSNAASLQCREYGNAGVKLSIIGFGGFMLNKMEQEQADRLVAESVERGVNYFDVAPRYGDAEMRLGPALEPYRKNVFLACKTAERGREGAEMELKRSLERLRTDHFDLYQLHGITRVERDVDAAFAKGGAMEVLIQAKREGRVRFLGFSAHSVEAALAAMDRYDFDSAMFPVNYACYHKGNFGPQIVEDAKSRGVARIALKALARQRWPEDDPERENYWRCWYQPITDPHEAELSVRFTLSQPVTAAIPPADARFFPVALDIAMRYKPLTSEEEEEVKYLAADLNPIFRTTDDVTAYHENGSRYRARYSELAYVRAVESAQKGCGDWPCGQGIL